MALKNFTQFTPQTVLSATDFVVGYRNVDEIRTDLDSLTVAISGLLIAKGFTPGGSVGTVKRINYRYTIDLGENLNAVSGMDDYGNYLSYTVGQLDVYRNGVHLVDSQDFIANNSTQIRNLSTMNIGDVVDVVTLSATGVTITNLLSGGGTVFQSNYRYTCPTTVAIGTINISGPDDLGNTLLYSSPTLDVYLNGSHLVNGLDYSASNGSTITLSEGLSSGDVLDIATLSAYDIGGLGGVSRIKAGPGIILNPSSGLGEVTVTGNTFQLTGGNIVIPIGSTRTYKKFSTAFYSLSSFLLDQTNTTVTFVVDPEVITETEAITLNHPDGEFMTLSGTMQRGFIAKSTSPGTNSPVTSVAFTTGGALSATLQFDNTLTDPQPGDYINIWSVSGAEARQIVNPYTADGSGNPVLYSSTVPVSEYGTLGFLTTGSPVIYYRQSAATTWPSFSARIAYVEDSTYPTRTYTLANVSDTAGSTSLAGFAGTASWFMDTGTPESFKGNRITGITLNNVLSASTLTFSDARATNTYLNQGDLILVLGQVFPVVQVGATNTCVIQGCIRLPAAAGWNRTASVPTGGYYYLVNSRIDYYIGAHRVVARPTSNTVTIEIAQSCVVDRTTATKGTGRTLFPPPRYGVSQIGLSAADTNDGVMKSVIRYSPPTAAAARRSQFMNMFGHVFGNFSDIAFESTRPQLSSFRTTDAALFAGLRLGSNFSQTVNAPASLTLSNVVFQSFYPYAITMFNSSNLSLNRVTINAGVSGSDGPSSNAVAIYSDNSSIRANRVSINGGNAPLYFTGTKASFNYLYIKNSSYLWVYWFGNSNITLSLSIFNNLGMDVEYESGSTAATVSFDTRGIDCENSNLNINNSTIIGGMNQGWLFLTLDINFEGARMCFWEMPNPDASSRGVAFYNGGNQQLYYVYHMGSSLIDGGSFGFWMDQGSNAIYGFCVQVGTYLSWYAQDNSNWVEYNSNSAFRNNVSLFSEYGLYNENNVSFRANLHNFRNTRFPIAYSGFLISGISTNTNVVGATTNITGVTQNIAPDANGNFLRYT